MRVRRPICSAARDAPDSSDSFRSCVGHRASAQGDMGGLQGANGWENFEGLNSGVRREQDRLQNGFGHRVGRHHFMAGGLGPERFPDVGVGGARLESDDADFPGTEFFAEGICESERRVLGRVVGGASRKDAAGCNGEIVDDDGPPLHQGKRGLRDEKHAVHVRGKDTFPDRIRQFVDRQAGVGDTGIVDQDIDLRKMTANGAKEIVY